MERDADEAHRIASARVRPLVELTSELYAAAADPARARSAADALLTAAEQLTAPDSLILASALVEVARVQSAPLFGAPLPATRAARLAPWADDPAHTLEPSRRAAALLARRAAAGTLYQLTSEEGAYAEDTGHLPRLSPSSSQAALSCLLMLAYWPPALRRSDEARAALVPTLRALVHGAAHDFSARSDELLLVCKPQHCAGSAIEALLLDVSLEPQLLPWTRAAVANTLCVEAVRSRILKAVSATQVQLQPWLTLLVEDARAALAADAPAHAVGDQTAAESTAAAVAPLRALLKRYEDARARARFAAARAAADELLAVAEGALPADSLVLVHALHTVAEAYTTPLHAMTAWATEGGLTRASLHDLVAAEWCTNPTHTLEPMRRAAGILLRRAAAGTLLCLMPHEQGWILAAPSMGSERSPFALLTCAAQALLKRWPPELRSGEDGRALLSLALTTLLEGFVSQFTVRVRMRSTPAATMLFGFDSGAPFKKDAARLMDLVLDDPEAALLARECGIDREALRAFISSFEAPAEEAPPPQDAPSDKSMSSINDMFAKLAAQKLRRQGGSLRSCANAACGTIEAHAGHFKLCAGCKAVVFCTRDCQLASWPQHKAACKAARKLSGGLN